MLGRERRPILNGTAVSFIHLDFGVLTFSLANFHDGDQDCRMLERIQASFYVEFWKFSILYWPLIQFFLNLNETFFYIFYDDIALNH